MHDAANAPQTPRYVPFKQEGWGIALFVVLLAVGTAATAAYIHHRTYHPPTDVRFQAAGSAGSRE
jgi:hypothetical protein